MKIQKYTRVRYANNPLAEVVCQARFPAAAGLADSIPDDLRAMLSSAGFIRESKEQIFSISIAVGAAGPNAPGLSNIFHFDSEGSPYRVSICSEFVALTCSKYVSWDDFHPRFTDAFSIVNRFLGGVSPVRLGLRYKDVIERESIGLAEVPWSELIAPLLLGPLSSFSLSDDVSHADEAVATFVSQSTIRLDDCQLLLQSALMRSLDGDRTAFLIDSDFFVESSETSRIPSSEVELAEMLTTLHTNAGSLFRRGIKERLHDALGPTPV